jgi:hypothetical protein
MIDSLERQGKRIKLQVQRLPLHSAFALGALVLLIVAFLIRTGILREVL